MFGEPLIGVWSLRRTFDLLNSSLTPDPKPKQAAGVSRATPRRKWPTGVLRGVVAELTRAAPRQLLARELWAGSGSAPDWLRRVRQYTSTSAVMSMVLLLPFACGSDAMAG